jgi:hypothetical protein
MASVRKGTNPHSRQHKDINYLTEGITNRDFSKWQNETSQLFYALSHNESEKTVSGPICSRIVALYHQNSQRYPFAPHADTH